MADQPVYVPDGPHYRCGLCGEIIPDGVNLDAKRDADGALLGVEARDGDGLVVHACGEPIDG